MSAPGTGSDRLTVDPRLRKAARWHAADMVNNRYFAHVSLAGSAPADRIRAAGLHDQRAPLVRRREPRLGSRVRSPRPADRVRALMHSPPHRRNMLGTQFREVGVWVAPRTPVHASYPTGATYVLNFGVAR